MKSAILLYRSENEQNKIIRVIINKNIFTCIFLFLIFSGPFALGQSHSGGDAEVFWGNIDFKSLDKRVSASLKLSKADSQLFFGTYLPTRITFFRSSFYEDFTNGKLNETDLALYPAKLEQLIIKEYPQFISYKENFSKAINLGNTSPNLRTEIINGPCTNMAFGQLNFTGWSGNIQVRNLNGPGGGTIVPGPIQNGFLEHCIMTPAIKDPYIVGLSVVPPAPAPQTSVRLGNVVSGGEVARITQTFMVTPNNILFTYRYAVVLEDPPKNQAGHDGLNRPHFSAVLTDDKGDTIRCAKYSVIVTPGLSGFTLACEGTGATRNAANIGCPAGSAGFDGSGPATAAQARLTTAPVNGDCGNGRSFYWKDWTTVSIPLEKYLGRNVTITFTASDCTPGAHLGYAYLQAECNPLPLSDPGYICSGKQTKVLAAPNGFASYKWIGPGIVGPSTTQIVTINKSGIYKMILIPLSDQPCPDTLLLNVREHCPPPAIADTLCESSQGSGLSPSIDLTSYNSIIVDTFKTATVVSWHTALPVSAANKIANPASVQASNGTLYYANISYPINPDPKITIQFANDAVALKIVLISRPKITPPSDNLKCSLGGTVSFSANAQIQFQDSVHWISSGVSISNPYVTAPTVNVAYVYPKKESHKVYVYAFKDGCPTVKDSFVVTVNPIPKIVAPHDTAFCSNITNIPLLGTSIGTDSVHWSITGLAGNFTHADSLSTQFKRTSTSTASSGTFTLTGYTQKCGQASDQVKVSLEAIPTLNIPPSDSICMTNPLVSASAAFAFAGGVAWTGNGGQFSPSTSATTIQYTPTQAEVDAKSVKLKAVTTPNSGQLCPMVMDSILVSVFLPPVVHAPSDTILCQPTQAINLVLTATSNKVDSLIWSDKLTSSGTPIVPSPKKGTTSTFKISQDIPLWIYVTGYNKGCLPVKDSMKVSFESSPSVTATPTPTCLADQRVLLAGTSFTKVQPNGTGTWSSNGSGGFIANADVVQNNGYIPSAADLLKGNVTLTLTSTGQKYCPAKDTSFVWPFVPIPLANAGKDDTVCIKSMVSRTTTSDPDWKYLWTSSPSGPSISTTPTATITAVKDTNVLFLTVTNSRNCTATDTVGIVTITPPQLSVIPKLCLYQPTQVTATITNPPALGTYDWSFNGKSLSVSVPSLLLAQAGKYSYQYQFGTCSSHADLQAFAPPVLAVKDTDACQNAFVPIVANAIPGALYYWGTNKVGTTSNSYPVNSGSGITNFKVLVIDQNSCRDSGTVNVTISPYPTFTIKGQDICPNQYSHLTARLDQPVLETIATLKYAWTLNNSAIPASSWKDLPYNQPGVYRLTLSIKGCPFSQSVTISNRPSPKIDIPLTYKHCTETDSIVTLVSNVFHSYAWYSPSGLIDTTQSVRVGPIQNTYYTLKVSNEYGCKDSVQVLVRNVCPPRLFVPNVITPESNDVNASLKIFGVHYTNFEITIFSRWGEVIFNTKDPKFYWNGQYRNENMPIGTYPWIVTYEGDSEEYKGPYKKVGDVTVVR
jgi:gliding motility-associated-like protein